MKEIYLEEVAQQNWFNSTYTNVTNMVSSLGKLVINATIGDSYWAYSDPEGFFKELNRRAAESGTNVGIGHIGPTWQNWLPKFYWVAGSDRASFLAIAEYGERVAHLDANARVSFDVVKRLIGFPTIINLHGEKAMEEKRLLRHHLNSAGSSELVYQFCLDTLTLALQEHQDSKHDESFPVLINRLIFTVLGQCVFGIKTELDRKYIPEFMAMSRLITNPWPSSAALNQANKRLREISSELIQGSTNSIDEDKYVAAHAQLNTYSTEAEKLEKLSTENIAASFLASTNIADLIMKTIATIGNNEEIKTKLVAELKQNWHGDLTSLNHSPYLELLYLEAQRMFPPSVIARRNSTSFTLVTTDDEQRTQAHHIPAYSYLFAPIRPRHLDPQLWENPHRFDPERFNGEEGKQREKLLVAFSDGSRSCPAKFGFTKMLFKTMIAGFFSQVNTFKLDKSLEEIPVFSINTSWQEDYQDEITLNECSLAKGA